MQAVDVSGLRRELPREILRREEFVGIDMQQPVDLHRAHRMIRVEPLLAIELRRLDARTEFIPVESGIRVDRFDPGTRLMSAAASGSGRSK